MKFGIGDLHENVAKIQILLKSDKNVRNSTYRGADKSLARPTSRCILFDGENISFDVSLIILVYINSNNITPIMIKNRVYENLNLLSL